MSMFDDLAAQYGALPSWAQIGVPIAGLGGIAYIALHKGSSATSVVSGPGVSAGASNGSTGASPSAPSSPSAPISSSPGGGATPISQPGPTTPSPVSVASPTPSTGLTTPTTATALPATPGVNPYTIPISGALPPAWQTTAGLDTLPYSTQSIAQGGYSPTSSQAELVAKGQTYTSPNGVQYSGPSVASSLGPAGVTPAMYRQMDQGELMNALAYGPGNNATTYTQAQKVAYAQTLVPGITMPEINAFLATQPKVLALYNHSRPGPSAP